jgi:cytochrome P450
MTASRASDWDPGSEAVLDRQCEAYDAMRQRCPVAYSGALGWFLFRHEDVVRVLEDHDTFSSRVSEHRSVPNGMDPPEHTAYRAAIEPFFAPERMREFEPVCRRLAEELLEPLGRGQDFDFVGEFAGPFAARCQCAFLGWPTADAGALLRWTAENQAATLDGDGTERADVARQFRERVGALLHARRSAAEPGDDVTARLMAIRVNGSSLTEEELTSILRNWTMGEVGSLAAAAGIVVHRLGSDSALQARLRGDASLVPAAIDEILRVSGPLVMNRRVATRAVELGGRSIAAGDRLSLLWISANRDEHVFDDPTSLRLERDQRQNLLYGAGIHVCPGAPLARLELRVAVEALFRRSSGLALSSHVLAKPAVFPANGWRSLGVRLA